MLYAAELQRCKEIQSIAEQPIWSETETLQWRGQATNPAHLCSRSKAFRHGCCVNLKSLGSCYVKGGGVGQSVERII